MATRKATTKKRNPGAKTARQWLNAVSQVCTKRRQKAGECSPSNDPDVIAARDLIRNTPAADRARFARELGKKKRNPSGRKRRNPDTAAEMFEAFTGRPATQETLIEEEIHRPTHLADLGELIELQAILPDGERLATIGFRGKGIRVACTANGKELHFVGGNQRVSLASLDLKEQQGKPNVLIGLAHKVTYHTSKHFHDFEPSDYEHELGEETGVKPLLGYDPRSEKLYLIGGAYVVRPEGIVN